MKLKDYIADSKLAVATEIYNANFASVEDVAALMEKIKGEEKEFNNIIHEFNAILYNIQISMSNLARKTKRLKKFNEFKSSYIAHLIKTFIENNTEDNMEAIKKEIERSNDFGVQIMPKQSYFAPSREHIHIGYTYTYYLFDKWDIDDDIRGIEKAIKELWSQVYADIDKRDKMYDAYGIDTLISLFTKFEEEHGSINADDEWES